MWRTFNSRMNKQHRQRQRQEFGALNGENPGLGDILRYNWTIDRKLPRKIFPCYQILVLLLPKFPCQTQIIRIKFRIEKKSISQKLAVARRYLSWNFARGGPKKCQEERLGGKEGEIWTQTDRHCAGGLKEDASRRSSSERHPSSTEMFMEYS